MIIDQNTRLEALLAANVSTTQLDIHVVYRDYNVQGEKTFPQLSRTSTNNSTAVVIMASPTVNPIRELLRLAVYQKDFLNVTTTIQTNNPSASTIALWVKQSLITTETLAWEKRSGWQII